MNKPQPKKQKKLDPEIEYLQNKLNTFNSKQLVDFVFNYSLLEDDTVSEEEQDKAYNNLMKMFYGKEGKKWQRKRKKINKGNGKS